MNLSKPTNDTSELSGSEEGGRYPDDDVLSGDDDMLSGDDHRPQRPSIFSTKDAHHKDKANNNNKTDAERSRHYSSGDVADGQPKSGHDASSAALTSGLLAGLPSLLANANSGGGTNGDSKEAQLNTVYGLIGNISAILKATMDNTKDKDGKDKGRLISMHAGAYKNTNIPVGVT